MKMLKFAFSISLGGCQHAIIWFMVTSWGTHFNSGTFWLITRIYTITIVLGDSKFSQNKLQWTLPSAYTLCLRWWRPRGFQGRYQKDWPLKMQTVFRILDTVLNVLTTFRFISGWDVSLQRSSLHTIRDWTDISSCILKLPHKPELLEPGFSGPRLNCEWQEDIGLPQISHSSVKRSIQKREGQRYTIKLKLGKHPLKKRVRATSGQPCKEFTCKLTFPILLIHFLIPAIGWLPPASALLVQHLGTCLWTLPINWKLKF